jgi:hypothetical protein
VTSIYNPIYPQERTTASAQALASELAKIKAAFDQVVGALNQLAIGDSLPSFVWVAYADSIDGTANFTTGLAGNRSFMGTAYNRMTAIESNNPEDYVWVRIRGNDAPQVVLQYSIDGVDWHVDYSSGDRFWRQSVDGGATFSDGAQLSAINLAVTASSQHYMNDVAPIVVEATFDGQPLAGQLPKVRNLKRYRGTTDVSQLSTWTIEMSGGVTAAIDDFEDSVSRGTIVMSALAVSSGLIRARSTYQGVTLAREISVTRHNATPPITTGGGGGGESGSEQPGNPAFDTTLTPPEASTSFVPCSDPLTVVPGSSGNVELTANANFSFINDSLVPVLGGLEIAWQRLDAGSWVNVGSPHLSEVFAYGGYDPETRTNIDYPGQATIARTANGLTPGTPVSFRLVARAPDYPITSTWGGATARPL